MNLFGLKEKITGEFQSQSSKPFFSAATLLYAISGIYGAAQKLRDILYQQYACTSKRLPCKVISIGNITVGGTGKTPMTVELAQRIARFGFAVAVVSRGYKGGAEKAGGIVSDGKSVLLDPAKAGDEPYLMACRLPNIPVTVGRNRFAAGLAAVRNFKSEVLILDDAFQHRKLARDMDLVLLDYSNPLGNSYLLPRGPLREPVWALSRAGAFIFTRSTNRPTSSTRALLDQIRSNWPDRPLFTTRHRPFVYIVKRGDQVRLPEVSQCLTSSEIQAMHAFSVFAFSGIARNDHFQRTVEDLGFNITGFCRFPDHHPYAPNDVSAIIKAAKGAGAEFLITTEKDYVRFGHRFDWPLDLIVVGIRIDFGDDDKRFDDFIKEQLAN
jgi:tetraacyldisaccharide 4'-kinase